MKQQLNELLDLEYRIEIKILDTSAGGGYAAFIPKLGENAFRGFGETADEALTNLDVIRKILFQKYLEEGIPVPRPDTDTVKEYSGRFVVRVPSELHRSLALEAKSNESPLNQYILYLLTRRSVLDKIHTGIKEIQCNMWGPGSNFYAGIKNSKTPNKLRRVYSEAG